MIDGKTAASGLAAVLLFTTLASAQLPLVAGPVEPVADHAVVAGFDRFYGDSKPEDRPALGRLLVGELNCSACHASDSLGKSASKPAPVLDGVGSRVRASYLKAFLEAPHKVKPGTTMPDLFAGMPEADRKERIEALVQFLASTGTTLESGSQLKDAKEGEQRFHKLGCVACHAPRKEAPAPLETRPVDPDDEDAQPKPIPPATIVPLGDLAAKYTLNSLSTFLKDPLAVRPAGRMPGFNLSDEEARDLASYFFKDHPVPPNVNFAWYEGHWDRLPDFSKLTPKHTGQTAGFDLSVTRHPNDFGVRFTGFLHLPEDGRYDFWLGSDDGSRLAIDGEKVVDVDGIHPHEERRERKYFTKGVHPIQVDYFQGGGEWTLSLDVAGPKVMRQPAAGLVTPTAEPPRPASPTDTPGFTTRPELVEKGRQLFTSSGCANCHAMKVGNETLQSTLTARPFNELKPGQGCSSLAIAPSPREKPVPHFTLSESQRTALGEVMTAPKPAEPTSAETVLQTMLALNCYACHSRGERGGVEPQRNTFFETTVKEMGDEGRLPPPLDFVGDKLQEGYLDKIVHEGVKDRDYVVARMPRFGRAADGLAAAFVKTDQKTAAVVATLDETPARQKSIGRLLIGDKGLSCSKCHPFNQFAEPGIQAMNLAVMARRLREDWFYRYLQDPQEYRRGTRMPGFFPEGKSTNKEILAGHGGAQMKAMWVWLSDGERAAVPSGLMRDAIVLTPTTEPILYRNFIEGLSPRGIAVGYPEQVHLAFDAERFGLALLWQGQFIDASKHWVGRGPGFQGPLGDNILTLPNAVPFAQLATPNDVWPDKPPEALGYKFRGYRLDKDRRPTFQYLGSGAAITDFPKPVKTGTGAHFLRTFTLHPGSGTLPPDHVYYRAAAGKEIKPAEGGWLVDGSLKIILKTNGSQPPAVRTSGDHQELLLPVEFNNGVATIEQTYAW